MQYRATLNYSERLVARAVALYWRRTIGVRFFVVDALVIAVLVWLVSSGDRSWLVGVLATLVVLVVLFPILIYTNHYRNSMSKFRQMARPSAEFTADEASFTLSSDLGSSTMQWNLITELWRFDSVWLLLFSKSQFVTIPLDDVSTQMRSFVVNKIKAAGGKIAV